MAGHGEAVYAYVALGANLGDRLSQLRAAARALDRLSRGGTARRSSIYQTQALVSPGAPPGPPYLNAVVELRLSASLAAMSGAQRLLGALLEIERRLGRVRDPGDRYAPRRIDLDLLLVDGLCGQRAASADGPALSLPHPELHRRAFVLLPLAELAPALNHPRLGRRIEDLAAAVDASLVARTGLRL